MRVICPSSVQLFAGLPAAIKELILKNIRDGVKLVPKDNVAVIRSVNTGIYNHFGRSRPDPDFCE